MGNNIVVFDYQGSNIPFELTGNDLMINVTEMAKPFGPNKKPCQWLRSKDAKEYLKIICDVRKLDITQLIKQKKGVLILKKDMELGCMKI